MDFESDLNISNQFKVWVNCAQDGYYPVDKFEKLEEKRQYLI